MSNLKDCPKRVLKSLCKDDSKISKSRSEYIELLTLSGTYEDFTDLRPIRESRVYQRNPDVSVPIHCPKIISTQRNTGPAVDLQNTRTSMAYSDSRYTNATITRSLFVNEVVVDDTPLHQSIEESAQTVNDMKLLVAQLDESMSGFHTQLNQVMYNHQFLLEIEPRDEDYVFNGHLHPGLRLGKGFGTMEHLNGNRAPEDVTNFWQQMLLQFKIKTPSLTSRVHIDHIVVSSKTYVLNNYWINTHPRFFVDDVLTEGDIAFSLMIPIEQTSTLSVQIIHASEEVTPEYEVVINSEVTLSCQRSLDTVQFDLLPSPTPTVVNERTIAYGDFVEWNCHIKFTSDDVGYIFDFKQLKLNLPFEPNTQQKRFNYLPMKSIVKYTTVDDTLHRTNGTAYIDTVTPEFLHIESSILLGLKSIEIDVLATYPYKENTFPMFTSMRYDEVNGATLTPFDIITDSSLVFSDGEMKWFHFNNRVILSCDLSVWQIGGISEGSDTFLFKLPSMASSSATGRYTGRCAVVADGKLVSRPPQVFIDNSSIEYVSISRLNRSLSPSYENTSRLINFNIQIDYISLYNEFVRTPPLLQLYTTTDDRLHLTDVRFRNGIEKATDVQIVEDKHHMTLFVNKQTITNTVVTRALFTAPSREHLHTFRHKLYSTTQWTIRHLQTTPSIILLSEISDLEVEIEHAVYRYLRRHSAYAKHITVVNRSPKIVQLKRPKPYTWKQGTRLSVCSKPIGIHTARSFILRKRLIPMAMLHKPAIASTDALRFRTIARGDTSVRLQTQKFSFTLLR